ncbi:hypothetical protein, partial [Pseudomonas lactucae]
VQRYAARGVGADGRMTMSAAMPGRLTSVSNTSHLFIAQGLHRLQNINLDSLRYVAKKLLRLARVKFKHRIKRLIAAVRRLFNRLF